MAMSPNDPFGAPAQPGASYGNPPGDGTVPPKKSKKGLFIALGCVGAAVLGCLLCCGGGLASTYFAMGAAGQKYADQLQGSPVIEEHIGEIEDFSFDFGSMMTRASENPGTEEIAFSVQGSKGSGVVYLQQDNNGGAEFGILSATLVTPDGTSYPIEIGNPTDGNFPVELNEILDLNEEPVPQ